jgi:hypothetical protein
LTLPKSTSWLIERRIGGMYVARMYKSPLESVSTPNWPHNCLRRSFCSHAVALHGSPGQACKRTIRKEC